jgi:hypothetical protein
MSQGLEYGQLQVKIKGQFGVEKKHSRIHNQFDDGTKGSVQHGADCEGSLSSETER